MNPQGKSRVRFQERAELLDFLLEVSAITGETLDLDRLLENVADIVRRVIPHELFAILLYNEKRRGAEDPLCGGPPAGAGPESDCSSRRRRDRRGRARPQAGGGRRRSRRANYLNAMDAVRSELAVPMVVRHKLVGVIDLQSTTLDAFSGQERALLQLIAGPRRSGHRQRAALPPRGPAEPDPAHAHAAGPGVQFHPATGHAARQDRQVGADADQLRRLHRAAG
jgi:sigma-B regulation protein RsbU (phosphoserine phosphatase)